MCQHIEYLRRKDVKLDSKAYIKTMALIAQISLPSLLQLRVFSFGSDEYWDVRVGVFPQGEEILIRGPGFYSVALHGIGSADLEMRLCFN
jgi:hypothetical protein